jgi:hypothetical protein
MLEAGTMGRVLFLRGVAIIIAAFCTAYVGDTLIARYRVATHKASALSAVTVYYSATMKNNKVVIFGGEPDTVTCIHALFSHFGYPTCRSLADKTINMD